jgi:S1-C subfamily serine protease
MSSADQDDAASAAASPGAEGAGAMPLNIRAPGAGSSSRNSSGASGAGSGVAAARSLSALGRTPMYTKPFDDDEHAVMMRLRKGVVQCFVSGVKNNWVQPWSKAAPQTWAGSGFIVSLERRLIVTNAHVVQFAATLQLRIDGEYDKHEASILAVNHQVDLAIVTVKSDAFWRGAVALPIGDDPRLQAHVDVVGYPKGGTGISITSGVVSRIDWNVYSHGMASNLCITVDAAINAGNSGGPAISKNKVCGVSFQGLSDADNIGYLIPASVLKRVLEDYSAQSEAATAAAPAAAASPASREGLALKGFAHFAPKFQTMEAAALRKASLLAEGESGVLIYDVPRVSNLLGVLEKADVLVAVDGEKVSNDGRVKRGDNSPMDFRVCVTLKLVGEKVRYTIVRNGEKRDVEAAAERVPQLTPATWYGPTQFSIFAGLVFVPATDAAEYPIMHAPYSLGRYHEAGFKHEHQHQQLPVLVTILPHSIMIGYEPKVFDPFSPLLSVDGTNVLSLADVHRLCAASAGPFTTFVFAGGRRIVLPTAEGRAATAELMKEHRITHEASSDIIAATAAHHGAHAPAAEGTAPAPAAAAAETAAAP